MRNLAYVMMASGLIMFGACEPNRDRATADENVMNDQRNERRGAPGDTMENPRRQNPAVGEELREGNAPDLEEGQRADGQRADGQRAEGHAMEGIPSNVRQKIDKEAADHDRKVLNSRPITHGGVQHYELTYLEKDGNQTKVTYDERGDEVDDIE